jgi:hypothetical protein
MTTTLKDFASKAKGKVAETRGGSRPIFENNKAYLVEVTALEHKTIGELGWNQAEIALSKVDGDGNLKKAGRVWLGLPVYSTEIEESYDQEKLDKMRTISANNFSQFLAGAAPETFGMTCGTKSERSAAVQGAAEALVAGDFPSELVVGNRLYYVRVPNKNNPDKYFDNFYATQPDKFEMAD